MTNLFPNKQQAGLATLMLTVIVLTTATLIVMFAAGYALMQQRINANQFRNQQAYAAAEAGLEYGINYLQQNSAVILASPSGGYIQNYTNSNTTNVSLANGSQYSIVYTNPVANNYNLILVTSTGTSADGTSTRGVRQQVQFGSVLLNPGTNALVTKGSVSMSGNSAITNTATNTTIQSSSTVNMTGNSQTTTSSGVSSTPASQGADIQSNVTSLQNMSTTDLFTQFFGASMNTIKAKATHYYSNNSNTNYNSTLNGVTGGMIWIDQTSGSATLSGNTVVGSAANPVLLIINGDFDLSGNVRIYGFVFIIGTTSATTDISGNVAISGGIVTADSISMSGNTAIAYNPTINTTLQTSLALQYYAKVPGSWKDF